MKLPAKRDRAKIFFQHKYSTVAKKLSMLRFPSSFDM